MFTSNPFTLLTEYLPPFVMQAYVVLMIFAVGIGTAFDLYHKRSAEYFALRRSKSKAAAQRRLGAGEIASLAIRTVGTEIASSGEFCKWKRRLSHLLMSYGFVIYLIATVVMVFVYATAAHTPIILTALWNIGALMVLIGGCWFFFILKVNVAHEGHSPFYLMHADLFIGSLLASVASGLLWHFVQTMHGGATATLVLFALYILFTTLLFVSVPWSKFAHMFYKPMAAFQKRLEEAMGASDLPRPAAGSNIRR
ncbi:MAG TPA: adenylyl-sulfate reductase [Thiobacillaceae bacterium]|nr:adenylyl-sulfate reductase [Thiobacillaceae bacterium]